MPESQNIKFFSSGRKISLKNRQKVKALIASIFKEEKRGLQSLSYIFCSDPELRKINKTYLNHDFFTDVVTFDLSDDPSCTMGEVYLSLDRIRDNASKFGNPLKSELLRVLIHGALHLCGYKDKTRKDKDAMRSREEYYLKKYRFT